MLVLKVFVVLIFIQFFVNAEDLSYQNDILPILSEKCFACHGPDGGQFGEKWRGGVRLDKKDAAFANIYELKRVSKNRKLAAQKKPLLTSQITKKKFAIVPGNPLKSTLIERIFTDDEDDVMPPKDFNHSLSDKEKNVLKKWIEQGAKYEKHWAYVKPQFSTPEVKGKEWLKTIVDSHILSKLEQKGIKASPQADKRTWLRRVSLDLAGLPPSVELLDRFLNDDSTNAKEKVVDEILKTDDFAERMALIWMDNARYADSSGFQFDGKRTMWPWRDWVINAFKQNMPFDQFVTKQLAGDLLPNPTQEDFIATGFNRNNPFTFEGGVISEEYRTIYTNDKLTTFGTLFLGMTLDCTRCHDHKYDELTMKDYYSLYAFFNTNEEMGKARDRAPANKPFIKYKGVDVMIMKEQPKPRKTFILNGGQWNDPGAEVTADTPAVLPPMKKELEKNRLGLAKWLLDSENPLMARVTVNRFWQHFMGQGIVSTADNFGVQGAKPTHRKLLDSLSVKFVEDKWDLHKLIKAIVLSSSYGQSSKYRPDVDDPQNKLYARATAKRLQSEIIRDQALAASGLLVRKIGGKSTMPYQPKGFWDDLAAPPSHKLKYEVSKGEALYRKSLYTFWRRAAVNPSMAVFDAPSRDVCTVTRQVTNTPLQALNLMHDPTYIEAAKVFARRLSSEKSFDEQISKAFQLLLSRKPSLKEQSFMKNYFENQLKIYKENPTRMKMLNDTGATKVDLTPAVAALSDCCLVLLNLSETITRN